MKPWQRARSTLSVDGDNPMGKIGYGRGDDAAEERLTLPAPDAIPGFCERHNWRGGNFGPCPDCPREAPEPQRDDCILPPSPGPGEPANAREVAEAMASYLNSQVAMLLFSKLTLYRAVGERPRVVVRFASMRFRVHIERSNGEKEHFNRDGEA